MGIPVFALFDADRGFQARAETNGKQAETIGQERNSHATENRRLLRYFGLPEEDFPDALIGDHVAIFEDHLEAYMAAHWPAWEQACQEMEAEQRIRLRKNSLAYRAAILQAGGPVPDCSAKY